MIVRCTHCDAAYAVDDKKIENKKFGFSCPKCGTSVIMDNRNKSESPADAFDFSPAPGGQPADSMEDEDFLVEKPSARAAEVPIKDDLAFDSDLLDRDMGDVIIGEGAPPAREVPSGDNDLGIDFEEDLPVKKPAGTKKSPSSEQEMMDDEPLSLEDFESGIEEAPADRKKAGPKDDYDDISFIEEEKTHAAVTAKSKPRETEEFGPLEEDLRLDDIVTYSTPADEPRPAKAKAARQEFDQAEEIILDDEIKTDEIFSREQSKKSSTEVDDSITIDLDTLDIELEEEPGGKTVYKEIPADDEFLMDDDFIREAPSKKTAKLDDDESTTIDLDSLDITLEEEEELKKGVELDEDERLTLNDTGLSIDDLSENELKSTLEEEAPLELFEEEEDIKLNLKEIDPSLSIDDLVRTEESSRPLGADEIEPGKLPEIDIDRFEQEEFFSAPARARTATGLSAAPPDSLFEIEEERHGPAYDMEHGGFESGAHDTVPGGAVNFSIDHSLGYSRIGALLRVFFLYYAVLIPHFIVLFIYSMLSSILGAANTWITLLTGGWQQDFAEIQEKTLRYMISIGACAADVVEEMPRYAGNPDIDYPLQLNVIFPVRNSRWMALLRATIIGMLVAVLPHLLILLLLSLGAVLISFAGLIALVATRRWPRMLFSFMVSYYNYVANVLAFMMGIVDRYPSFRVE